VALLTHDGREVHFLRRLVKDKTVIYHSCTRSAATASAHHRGNLARVEKA